MAESFLDGLSQIDLATLPEGSVCKICHVTYGNGTEDGSAMEAAVRLPCGHDFGADCIRTWLSPDKEAKNSCPYCRTEFWDFESESVDEDDWHGAANPFSRADPFDIFETAIHFIEIDGQPPREGQEEPQRAAREAREMHAMRQLFPEFLGITTEQYQESIRRAREMFRIHVTLRRDLLSDSSVPTHELPEELEREIEERVVRDTAMALRTLAYRESILYWILRDNGNESLFPPQDEDNYFQPLNAEREEALLRVMERRGAFNEFHLTVTAQYASLTNRERWQAHRDVGETWDPATAYWVTDWSDGLHWILVFEDQV